MLKKDVGIAYKHGLSLGLSPEPLARARGRVQLMAGFGLLGFGTVLTFAAIRTHSVPGFYDRHLNIFVGDSILVSVCLILLAIASWPKLVRREVPSHDVPGETRKTLVRDGKLVSDRVVLFTALVIQVLACLTLSLASSWYYSHSQHAPPLSQHGPPLVTWVTPIIIMYPLIIPTPLRFTLAFSVLCALTVPLGLELFDVGGTKSEHFVANLGPWVAVLIAVLGSRGIYRVTRAAQFSNYELLGELPGGKAGGMGEVWRARHTMLQRPAAIKLIKREVLEGRGRYGEKEAIERFEREAKWVAQLKSPHTVTVYDFGVSRTGEAYFAMELLDGYPVNKLSMERLPPSRLVYLLCQVCDSLAEAHEQGKVHRDIKPSNVMVCRYGREADFVKVIDFGIATTMAPPDESDAPLMDNQEANVELTDDRRIVGTPGYVSPEQVNHFAVDATTDIYALGCLAYLLVANDPAFKGKTSMDQMTRRLYKDPIPLKEVAKVDIPDALADVIMSCLERDPKKRPRTVVELAEKLKQSVGENGWDGKMAREWWDEHYPPQEKEDEAEPNA